MAHYQHSYVTYSRNVIATSLTTIIWEWDQSGWEFVSSYVTGFFRQRITLIFRRPIQQSATRGEGTGR
jgi:hypothetical protein